MGPPVSTSASDLHKFSAEVLQENDIQIANKLVGIACDGASNMMGCKSGFTTLYKHEFRQLFIMHCLCHRLELAFKDSIKKIKVVDKVQQVLTALYYFYHKSGKQQGQLLRVFKELGIDGVMPPRAGGTR